MDVQLIEQRIQALRQTRDACECQSDQARQLKQIANMLIDQYEDIKQQLLIALADGFLADDCDNANGA